MSTGADQALDRMRSRVAEINERAVVRAWEDRQRGAAAGVWQRLRRLLVDTDSAWVIGADAADRLEAEGHTPHPVGTQLEPPKRLFCVDPDRIGALPGASRIPVRLCAEFLQAREIVLIAHRRRA
ncbi:MAG: hypothetical protein EA382_13355 [Spirochaetaceae bacterium]|nr:MAG: hypothetical protein EA382_13355 [Spirochaetaceae bacterium]